MQVRHAQDEGLIALVRAAVQKAGGLGVGARDNDAGNLHDIELEARSIEPLHLLVLRDQHLAALVAALLHARLLIFDVIAGNAHFHEAANQIANVRIAAVARCRRRQ